jgi:hypothetical protein
VHVDAAADLRAGQQDAQDRFGDASLLCIIAGLFEMTLQQRLELAMATSWFRRIGVWAAVPATALTTGAS